MNIFQFAMEKEKFSEDYYRQLAGKTDNKGLKNICNMLADEESKHYKIVEQISQQMPAKLSETAVLGDAKKMFANMRESAEKFKFDISELELYEKARDIEQKAKQFYIEKAKEIEDQVQKGIFLKLAAEEQKHFILLDNICSFVSKPQRYLENAEFNHIENYVDGVF